MAKETKKQSPTATSLSGIKDLAQAGLKVGETKITIPKMGAVKKLKVKKFTLEGIRTILEAVNASITQLRENLGLTAEVLTDDATAAANREGLNEASETITSYIRTVEVPEVSREDLVRALVDEGLKALPKSLPALQFLVDMLIAVGFCHRVGKREMGSIFLPHTSGEGMRTFSCFAMNAEHPRFALAWSQLVDATKHLQRLERRALHEEKKSINAQTLLDWVDSGCEGEVAFVVPESLRGERRLQGGIVTVVGNDGEVTPVGGHGPIQGFVARLVEARVFLPTSEVGQKKVNFGMRLGETQFRLGLAFADVLRRGIEHAAAEVEKDPEDETGGYSVEDFTREAETPTSTESEAVADADKTGTDQ